MSQKYEHYKCPPPRNRRSKQDFLLSYSWLQKRHLLTAVCPQLSVKYHLSKKTANEEEEEEMYSANSEDLNVCVSGAPCCEEKHQRIGSPRGKQIRRCITRTHNRWAHQSVTSCSFVVAAVAINEDSNTRSVFLHTLTTML